MMPKLIKKWKLKIYNLKTDKMVPEGVAYVGRPTPFGNPYSIGKGTREACVKKYSEYLTRNLAIAPMAKKYLRGKNLSCWCSPLPCHAELLMEVANS